MSSANPARRHRVERAAALQAITVVGFAVVSLGLIRLQVTFHERYRDLAKENHVRLEVKRAPRGTIYDRNGVLLVDSAPAFAIVFRPFPAESLALTRVTQSPDWLERVSSITGVDSAEVRTQVATANATGKTAFLVRNAKFSIRAAVEETRGELPGIDVQIEPLRRYAHGTLAAHLLGYAGEINDKELEERAAKGYGPGDLIGRSGVERQYEDQLRGKDGAEFVVVNAMGRRVSTLSEGPPQEPKPGHDLVLTIDLKVQQAMEEAMADVERGAAVALDPRDGSVLGLVSRPAFDPNEFSIGLSLKRWKELSGGGANPLLDRAIQGVYPPGSTFKVVSMLAALREGIAKPTTRLAPCSGRYFFGGRSFGCWKKEGHGSLDFVGAIQHSCDVYFYQIGPRLGLQPLEQTAREFGLGDKVQIDLPQEKKGLVPSPAWYDERWGVGRWRKGMMLNLAIGQGELLVTPLQLATMMAEAGNGGHALRPHVVREIRGVPEYAPEKPQRNRIVADEASWRAVRQGLEMVVEAGTGTMARVPGIRVAGKTGTAQNPHGKDHALFACYAPADNPTIALAFVVENSGHGGSIAAPRAGKVLQRVLLPDSVYFALHPPERTGARAAAPDTAQEVASGD
jgi:penicillin-binding protein 2